MPLGALAEDSFRRVNEVFYSPASLLHIYVLYLAAAACSRERKIFFVPAKGTFSTLGPCTWLSTNLVAQRQRDELLRVILLIYRRVIPVYG